MIDVRKFLSSLWRGLSKVTLNTRMEARRKCRYPALSGREDGIVISLTSFPPRMGTLWITLDSLFRQSVLPDKIVLYLTAEEFPGRLADVPAQVKRFMDYGLEIEFMPENLYSHMKYFHALQRFTEAKVITVDDDSYYPRYTVERLMALNGKYPGAVCANIASVIEPSNFYDYSSWKRAGKEQQPSMLCVALGFSGVLYPPHVIGKQMFDKDLFMSICPKADDLWLKANEMDMGIKVACGGFFPKPVTIRGSQKVSLRKFNKGAEDGHNRQWKALEEHFHLKEKI